MADLLGQHQKISKEIEEKIKNCIESSSFIGGEELDSFNQNLAQLVGVPFALGCANGTDALQLALMALELKAESEIIVPNFTFVAPAEVVALLGFTPVFADVCPNTYNLTPETIKPHINSRTKAIIVVHLFGQSADMRGIMELAHIHNLLVIEDLAQSLGAICKNKNQNFQQVGTFGNIGTTSFFPTKNLGALGDGGAVFTNDEALAEKVKIYANHGALKKYTYQKIGINSRLDNIQAAVLNVKLQYFKTYLENRKTSAEKYIHHLSKQENIVLPLNREDTPHTYNQFTIQIPYREEIKKYLSEKGIPSMIYYPSILSDQFAFSKFKKESNITNAEKLTQKVLSLPMHTELDDEQIFFISKNVLLGLEMFCR